MDAVYVYPRDLPAGCAVTVARMYGFRHGSLQGTVVLAETIARLLTKFSARDRYRITMDLDGEHASMVSVTPGSIRGVILLNR